MRCATDGCQSLVPAERQWCDTCGGPGDLRSVCCSAPVEGAEMDFGGLVGVCCVCDRVDSGPQVMRLRRRLRLLAESLSELSKLSARALPDIGDEGTIAASQGHNEGQADAFEVAAKLVAELAGVAP